MMSRDRWGSARVTGALAERVRADSELRVADASVRALGEATVMSPRAVNGLRETATRELADAIGARLRRLRRALPPGQDEMLVALRALGNPRFSAATTTLVAHAKGYFDSRAVPAMEALYAQGYAGREEIYREQLESWNEPIVACAARLLMFMGEPALEPRIRKLLKHEDEDGRYQAYLTARYLPKGPGTQVMLGTARACFRQYWYS